MGPAFQCGLGLDAIGFVVIRWIISNSPRDMRSGARSGGLKSTDLARFYFSSALFARYLRALRANDTGPDALAISDRVVAMVERGRRLEKPS